MNILRAMLPLVLAIALFAGAGALVAPLGQEDPGIQACELPDLDLLRQAAGLPGPCLETGARSAGWRFGEPLRITLC
jgi:hypothetical protein